MNKNYKKIELDKILCLLSEQAYSDACREEIDSLTPLCGTSEIESELAKTGDAFRLSAKFGTPRFSNIQNPGKPLMRAEQGGSLSLRELLDIAAILREINILISWESQHKEENSLTYNFSILTPDKPLLERLDAAIISEDEVADTASPELFRIRRGLEKQALLIRERLDKLIRNSDTKKYLQESLVTQRDGRFVIPVKSEHKNEIPGLVHDTSGTGATLFVEPMGVVEANNEIRVLKSKEKSEIERIIAELSGLCGGIAESLNVSYDACIKIEMSFAKANLGAKMRGIIPKIVSHPVLDLQKARHPLINGDVVVPMSILIGEDYTSLVVTGPNTGGKTVAIKTAGLLTLMTRCGLMIPAADGSRIGIFGEVYADIGDEQSIEQSLSTFSSHMNNIVRILETAGQGDLVLLDELGSGTDPSEGGALAVAVLDYLKEKGCLVMATTHYQEVKIYAIETDGVENASCEFDTATLRPTYRLITGAPGKSNALDIAKRLGLSEDIIHRAKNLVSTENKRFDDIIRTLEDSRLEIEELKSKISQNERDSRESALKLQEQSESMKNLREKEMQNARNRAMSIIESVRVSTDAILNELEELKRDKDKSDFSEKVRGMRSKVNSALNKLHDDSNPIESVDSEKAPYTLPRPLRKFDTVLLADINKKGSLISLPDSSGNCMVQIGIVKTKTNAANLRLVMEERVMVNGKPIDRKPSAVKVQMSGGRTSHGVPGGRNSFTEVDIRGMSSDEGISAVDSFIDSSIVNNIFGITIIHGKGTGILRQAIHGYLRGSKLVKEYRLGKYGEGEDGVTIVSLQE
ncbi:MAG: endonuclease MutS2 [Oscillospiraceae bacterium]|nr:endonuclease MutS2 [Oscillospiraceae bacterium]